MARERYTTAYYRAEALAEAKVCNWFRAARLMERAIELYPDNGGELAKRDLKMMRAKLRGYEQAFNES